VKLVCVGSGQVEERVDPDLTGLVAIIGPYLLTQPRKPSASYKPNRVVSFVENGAYRKASTSFTRVFHHSLRNKRWRSEKKNRKKKLENCSENGSVEFDGAEGFDGTTRGRIPSGFHGSSSYATEIFLQTCRSSNKCSSHQNPTGTQSP
jgi:hypothetical protein